ncbi:MAG: aminotransferase class I/II-fold pyridoxal phosphate-dependent enzyme [Bacillota bacterium]
MQFNQFKLERYFSQYEFNTEYLLSSSDCESLSKNELLELTDETTRQLWEDLDLGYTETRGHPLLREEIAKLYEGVSAQDIVVAAPAEGIFLSLNALLESGDHVISMFPAYQSLYEIPRSLGCKVSKWPVELKNGSWQLDLDLLEESITAQTKMIIVNFPHNPTGYLPSKQDFARLLDIVRKHDLHLFSDEMYKFSEYKAEDRLTSPGEIYEKGISLSGLSKSFGLPGLRIGWIISKEADFLNEVLKFKDYTTICSSAPSEILGIAALRAKNKILNHTLAIITDNLQATEQFFADYEQLFTWYPPQAGPIAFPQLKEDLSVENFCRDLVEKESVMLLPGSVFEVSGNHFRLGLGRENYQEGLNHLKRYIKENI